MRCSRAARRLSCSSSRRSSSRRGPRPRRWCRVPADLRPRQTRGTPPRVGPAARSSRRAPRASRARTRGWSRASRTACRRGGRRRPAAGSARRGAPGRRTRPAAPRHRRSRTRHSAVSIGPPPANTPEPREQPLILRFEQVVAPVDGTAQRPLPLRQVARARRQQAQPVAQPLCHRGRREQPDPGRRELDRQRQAVEAADDLGHRLPVRRREHEVRPHRHRAFHEQPDGLGVHELRDVGDTRGRQRERRDRELLLAGDPQRGTAGDDHRQLGRRAQEVGDDRRPGDDLLEVVEDEQRVAVAEVLLDAVDRRPLRREQAERAGDRGRHEVRVRHGRERHEPGAVRVPLDAVARQGQRQPRLAGPAGARERQEARPVEERHGVVDLPAPDEARELRWQVVRRQVEGPERRERGLEGRRFDLVQPLRPREVLEVVLAEVPQCDAGARDRRRPNGSHPSG